MIIQLKKFGTTLVSRPAGKEASLAFAPVLAEAKDTQEIVVDFDGVVVLTPSWADEFLTPLMQKYQARVKLRNTQSNPSIVQSLKILGLES